jgi:hypothetical protein
MPALAGTTASREDRDVDPDARGADAAIVEELDRDECLRLLATQVVGRVAVAEPGEAPLVVPVNFLLVEERVLFRTDFGAKFRSMVLAERPVSFQADALDPGRRTGWSVLVTGRASEVGDWEASGLPLRPWAAGPRPHVVQVVPESVTGRRLRLPELPEPEGRRGYL